MQSRRSVVVAGFLLVLLLVPAVVTAATYTVRQDLTGDFTTIAAAVNGAADNDTIDVGPGTYNG